MTNKIEQFKQTLDECHEWPCPYTYKFIMPTENLDQLTALFPNETMDSRESKNGKYTSITVTLKVSSADAVMAIYEKAATVPGLMSL